MNIVPVSDLIGKTIASVVLNSVDNFVSFYANYPKKEKTEQDFIDNSSFLVLLRCNDESNEPFDITYVFTHQRDYCEKIDFIDCDGIDKLIGQKIVDASEVSENGKDSIGDSQTWTFYKIQAEKDSSTLRFSCCSNGYYSERIDIFKLVSER